MDFLQLAKSTYPEKNNSPSSRYRPQLHAGIPVAEQRRASATMVRRIAKKLPYERSTMILRWQHRGFK